MSKDMSFIFSNKLKFMRHLPHSELKLRGVNAQQQNAHVQSPCTLQAKEFLALVLGPS